MSRLIFDHDFNQNVGNRELIVDPVSPVWRENTDADWRSDGDKAWGDGGLVAPLNSDAQQVLIWDASGTGVFFTVSADPNKLLQWEVECFVTWPDVLDPNEDYTCGIIIHALSTPATGFERVNWWWRKWPNSSPVESMDLRKHSFGATNQFLNGTTQASFAAAQGLPAVTGGQTYLVKARMRVFNNYQHCEYSIYVDNVLLGSVILPANWTSGTNFAINYSAKPKNHGLYVRQPFAGGGTPVFLPEDRFKFDGLKVRDLNENSNFPDPFPVPMLNPPAQPTNTLAVEDEDTDLSGTLPQQPEYVVPMIPQFQTGGGGYYDSGHKNVVALQSNARKRWGLNFFMDATEYATMRTFVDARKLSGVPFNWTDAETQITHKVVIDGESVQWAQVSRNPTNGILYRMSFEVEEVR